MKKWQMAGLVIVIVLIAGIVIAEQITFSTYYPAPNGAYKEMNVYYLDFKAGEYQEDAPTNMPPHEEGRITYDSQAKVLKRSDGTNWQALGGGGGWVHSDTLIFQSTRPQPPGSYISNAAWTTLDLSSIVGENYTFVLLEIQFVVGNDTGYLVRPKNDNRPYYIKPPVNEWTIRTPLFIETDSQGKIEIRGTPSSGEPKIWIAGYANSKP